MRLNVRFCEQEQRLPLRFAETQTLKGDPGFSPTVAVAAIPGGHRLTVTDAGGEQRFDVLDGENAPRLVTLDAPTAIALADNTEYRLTGVAALTLSYPAADHWSCWLRLTTAPVGAVTVTLPTSRYIGGAPTLGVGETWELSIRDGVVVAGKAEAAS